MIAILEMEVAAVLAGPTTGAEGGTLGAGFALDVGFAPTGLRCSLVNSLSFLSSSLSFSSIMAIALSSTSECTGSVVMRFLQMGHTLRPVDIHSLMQVWQKEWEQGRV